MAKKEKIKGTGCLATTLIGIPLVIIILILGIWMYRSYNRMVTKEEAVVAQWAQVENTYQRRADLILNLAETVKGYATHEQTTLTNVIEARSKATSININAEKLNEQTVQNFQNAQDGLSSSLSKLMVVIEKYPDLKANQGFLKLQNQLEQIENTILLERMAFNEIAKIYNVYVRKFPHNIFASWFGFETKGYFESKEGTDVAPKVEF